MGKSQTLSHISKSLGTRISTWCTGCTLCDFNFQIISYLIVVLLHKENGAYYPSTLSMFLENNLFSIKRHMIKIKILIVIRNKLAVFFLSDLTDSCLWYLLKFRSASKWHLDCILWSSFPIWISGNLFHLIKYFS